MALISYWTVGDSEKGWSAEHKGQITGRATRECLSLWFGWALSISSGAETLSFNGLLPTNDQRHLCYGLREGLGGLIPDTPCSGTGAGQGWICRLPGARENITVCGVAPVPASTHRVS